MTRRHLLSTRFTRRVAFGIKPGEVPPEDPLQWAIERLRIPGEIAIRDGSGLIRSDLPAWVELKRSNDQVMAWFGKHQATEQNLRQEATRIPRDEFLRVRRERLGIPFQQVEHWKEVQARASTAVSGVSPVFEKFWHFWTNHFMVAPGNQGMDTLVGPFQRMLRDHMSDSYREMLWQAVTHPAMLLYLDNHRSTGPNSRVGQRRGSRESINENLGRELLELFTLSPRGGYSQSDVEQTTLILTGWRVNTPVRAEVSGIPAGTWFDVERHEPGDQTVLGKPYAESARNSDKLANLITDLANHPATAMHLARKLCTHFIDDDPPVSAVEHVRHRFMATGGNLHATHIAVIEMVWQHLPFTRKLSTPESWLLQWHTLTGGELPPGSAGLGFLPDQLRRDTAQILRDLGQALPYCPQPDGWPIRSADWLSKELLDRRVRHALLSAEHLWRRRGGTEMSILTLAERELDRESTTYRIVHQALSEKQHPKALALLMLSPELLWS